MSISRNLLRMAAAAGLLAASLAWPQAGNTNARAGHADGVHPGIGLNPGRLSVRGRDLVDPAGKAILLRGWNWGHWGKAVERDAADNATQGANVVRLPVRWWGYYQGGEVESRNDAAPGGIDPAHLRMLDDNVRWASQAHLWIVLFLDSNCGQNGLQNAKMVAYCDPRGQYPHGHNFFEDRAERARFIALWRFIAARYKDIPYLGLFEPLPEPGNDATPPEQIRQFYAELTDAIREVAPGVPFLLGGNRYRVRNVADVFNPAWKDVVYTGNLFGHENGEGGVNLDGLHRRLQQLVNFRRQHNVPVFVQQVGIRGDDDPDQSRLRDLLAALNQDGVGYTYWEYRGTRKQGDYAVVTGAPGDWHVNQAEMSVISQAFRQR